MCEKISIQDWIKLPETQALERHYKELGMLPEASSWNDFTIVESLKAYEVYIGGRIRHNQTYCHVLDPENPLSKISYTLMSLRIAAISSKPVGYEIGGGKLTLQSRASITITPEGCYWRGNMFRLEE